MTLAEPAWLVSARKDIGVREWKGPKHNPIILGWLKELDAWWSNDEDAWCGVFVAHHLQNAGRGVPKHWYRALAYADPTYGTRLDNPCVGCLAVFTRTGGGHVAIVVGIDKYGNIMCIGGNQGDQVSIIPFNIARNPVWIWPPMANGVRSAPLPERYSLPLLKSDGKVSVNEA